MEQLITNNSEIFDKDDDNLDDYIEACYEYNKLTPDKKWYCNFSIMDRIDEIKDELPF